MIELKTYSSITRDEAAAHPERMYVFTDNTDRDSGSNPIDHDSPYYRQWGNGKELHYPTVSTAVLRGLPNAYPVTTQRYYHEGAKGYAGRWYDDDADIFDDVISRDFDLIRKAMLQKVVEQGSSDLEVLLPGSHGGGSLFTDGRISQLTQERTPVLYRLIGEGTRSLIFTAKLWNLFSSLDVSSSKELSEKLNKASREVTNTDAIYGLKGKPTLTGEPEIDFALAVLPYMTDSDRQKVFLKARIPYPDLSLINPQKEASVSPSKESRRQSPSFGMDSSRENHERREALRKYTLCSDVLRLLSTKGAYNAEKGSKGAHTKNGMYYSPFREEKGPSFHIDERKNTWFDHGISKGGDAYGLCKEFLILNKGYSDSSDALSDEVYAMLSAASGLPAPEYRPQRESVPADRARQLPPVNIWASRNENTVLSNLARRPFRYKEMSFHCVEQAFQWVKAEQYAGDHETAKKILLCANGYEAQKLGSGTVKFRTKESLAEWDKEKFGLMYALVYQSLRQNPDAREALLATGKAPLTHSQASEPWKTWFPQILTSLRSSFSEEIVDEKGLNVGYAKRSPLNVISIKDFSPEGDLPEEQAVIEYAYSCGIPYYSLKKYCKLISYTFREGTDQSLKGIFFPNSTPRAEGEPETGEIRGLPYASRSTEEKNSGIKMSYGPKEMTVLDRDGNLVPMDRVKLHGKITFAEGWKDMINYMSVEKEASDFYVVLNSTSLVQRALSLIPAEEVGEVHTLFDNDKAGRAVTKQFHEFAEILNFDHYDESYRYRHIPGADFNQYYCGKDLGMDILHEGMALPEAPSSELVASLSASTGISGQLLTRYGTGLSVNAGSVHGFAFAHGKTGMVSYWGKTDPSTGRTRLGKTWINTDGVTVIRHGYPSIPDDKVTEVVVFASMFDALSCLEWGELDTPPAGTAYLVLNGLNEELIIDGIKVFDDESITVNKVHLMLPATEQGRTAAKYLESFYGGAGITVQNPGEKIYGANPKAPSLCMMWKAVKRRQAAEKRVVASPAPSPSSAERPSARPAPGTEKAPNAEQPAVKSAENSPSAEPQLTEPLLGLCAYSGGNEGAERLWGEQLAAGGAKVYHYYYGKATPCGNCSLPDEAYREGLAHAESANASVGGGDISSELPRIAAAWFAVRDADALFVIGSISVGIVQDESRWAVQMATDERKPVYFFDQISKKWLQRVYPVVKGEVKPSWRYCNSIPTLTTSPGLTGTADLKDCGRDAISEIVRVSAQSRSILKMPSRGR